MSESDRELDREHAASVVRLILLGELSAQQACDQEGISLDQLTDWMRVHRRAVRRSIDEQIGSALSAQGLEREDFVLSGNLQSMTLSDLLETIQLGRKHAHIRIEHDAGEGQLWCAGGEVIDAQAGTLVGSAALFQLLALQEGRLQAEFSAVEREHTILASTRELMVEFARRTDELARMRKQIGDTTRVLWPMADEAARSQLDPQQRDVLGAFDGIRSIDAVIAARKRPELETLSTIARLFERQCLVTMPLQDESPSAEPPGSPASVHLAAQPGYASLLPNSGSPVAASVTQVSPSATPAPSSVVPSSRISVPPVAPSVQVRRSVPVLARRYAPFAVLGGCALLAFAVGLWTAHPAPRVERVLAAPSVAEDVGSAVCGAGMALFTSGSSLARAGSARAPLRPFCLEHSPVSTEEYQACVGSQQCEPARTDAAADDSSKDAQSLRCNAGQPGRERFPINCITQRQAEQYCAWRGRRLPLPDEWEAAWQSVHRRLAVDALAPDAWRDPGSGASHLGDLSEWTKDRAERAQRGAGPGAEQQLFAVLRVDAAAQTTANGAAPNRLYMTASAHARGIGFRCALSVETSPALGRLE